MFPSDDGRGRIPPFSPPSLSLSAPRLKKKEEEKGVKLPSSRLSSIQHRVQDWPTGRETWLFCAEESFGATSYGMLFSVLWFFAWRIPHHLPPSWARSLGSPLLGRRRGSNMQFRTLARRKKKAAGKKIYLSTCCSCMALKYGEANNAVTSPIVRIFSIFFFPSHRL